MRRVEFLEDDRYGLWKAGETATHLGRESDHPDSPDIHLFDFKGQTICLDSPFSREIVRSCDEV